MGKHAGNSYRGVEHPFTVRAYAPGDLVVKLSGRPFKSGQQVNTVQDVIVHPQTGRWAFTFLEDDSYCEVGMVEKVSCD